MTEPKSHIVCVCVCVLQKGQRFSKPICLGQKSFHVVDKPAHSCSFFRSADPGLKLGIEIENLNDSGRIVMLVPVPINARCSTPNSSADDMGDLNSLSVKRYRFASCFLTCDWISRGLTCQTFADIKIASNAIIYFTEKEKKKRLH